MCIPQVYRPRHAKCSPGPAGAFQRELILSSLSSRRKMWESMAEVAAKENAGRTFCPPSSPFSIASFSVLTIRTKQTEHRMLCPLTLDPLYRSFVPQEHMWYSGMHIITAYDYYYTEPHSYHIWWCICICIKTRSGWGAAAARVELIRTGKSVELFVASSDWSIDGWAPLFAVLNKVDRR